MADCFSDTQEFWSLFYFEYSFLPRHPLILAQSISHKCFYQQLNWNKSTLLTILTTLYLLTSAIIAMKTYRSTDTTVVIGFSIWFTFTLSIHLPHRITYWPSVLYSTSILRDINSMFSDFLACEVCFSVYEVF